jgi:two-component system response regulator YesN
LGRSLKQFHKELRLEKAGKLLENPALKVKQIRLEIGYQDHSRFFRDFKKYFGPAPLQYRERHITTTLVGDIPTEENS